MSSGRINVGIIGFGRMGQKRLEIMQQNPVWSVKAVADPDLSAAQAPQGVAFYSDYRKLLDEKLDAVIVCTPNHITAEAVVRALESGRHVLAEKPPGRNMDEVRTILAAAKANPKLKLKFGFNHRYHDAIREAKAIVDSGRWGRLMWMRGIYGKSGGPGFEENWRSRRDMAGGGILLDQGIHMVDLLRLFAGEFEDIRSFVTNTFWSIDVEDNAFALLRNANNQIALLHSSSTQWKHLFSLEIYLSEGYIAVNGILSGTRSYGRETLIKARRQPAGESAELGRPREEVTYYDQDNSWQLELEEFSECVLQDKPVRVGTPNDVERTMELVERIYDADPTWQAQRDRPAAPPRKREPTDELALRTHVARHSVVRDDLRSTEIRPEEVYSEFLKLTREETGRMFQPARFTAVACPACGSTRHQPAFTKDGFSYADCPECRSLFASPRPPVGDLDAYYKTSSAAAFWRDVFLPSTLDRRRQNILKPRAEWIAQLGASSGLASPLRCIDLGSGYGQHLTAEIDALHTFSEVKHVPFSVDMAASAKDAGSAQVTTAFEVMEKVSDPFALLSLANRLLVPGGLFVFTTMTISGLDLQVLWDRARNIFPPDHINLLSIEGFERLAARTGFDVLELSTPGLLDIEILKHEMKQYGNGAGFRFWHYLVERRDPVAMQDFQELLQKHRLSSHVRAVFRKRVED